MDGGVTMLERSLVGKRALVTGGSRGIGRATALMLARAGAQIGISYFDRHEEARALISEIERLGVPAWVQSGNIASAADVDRLFDRALHAVDRLAARRGSKAGLESRPAKPR